MTERPQQTNKVTKYIKVIQLEHGKIKGKRKRTPKMKRVALISLSEVN